MTSLRSRCFLPAIAALLIVGASGVNALVAGATPGQFSVNQGGAATYTIPIEVPAGIGGVQPSLTLQYSSQAGRGLAGLGWTLSGASSVKRCPQTLAQDGRGSGINFTASDRFCLDDGQRLVLVAPPSATDPTNRVYGADGAVYSTEIDAFTRITSVGITGTGPTSFKAETKSGLTLEFGTSSDSRMLPASATAGGTAPQTILMWALRSVTDRSGNTVTYTYLSNSAEGSHRLDRIDYNSGKSYVKLQYTADSNPLTAYIAGTKVTHPVLLSSISTFVVNDSGGEVPVKAYRLSYDYVDVKGGFSENGQARLTAFHECAPNGECRAPISFSWAHWDAESNRSFGPAIKLFGESNNFSAAEGWGDERAVFRRFADMDKDGHLDIVGFGHDGVYVSYVKSLDAGIRGTARTKVTDQFGHGYWQGVENEFHARHLIDMNRDGYADIVGFNNVTDNRIGFLSGMYVAIWDPVAKLFKPWARISSADLFTHDGFNAACGFGSEVANPKYLVDMNKDNYPDIIGFGRNGIYYSEWDGATSAVSAPKLVSGAFRMRSENGSGNPDQWLTTSCMATDRQPIYLEDMNADGYPDVLAIGVSGTYLLLWDSVNKVFSAPARVSTSFTSAFRVDTLYPSQVADMNGDGYPDLVGYRPSGLLVSLWTGTGFNPATYWTSEFTFVGGMDLSRNPRRIVDVNGDGFPDAVNFANDGVHVGLSNGNGKIFPAVRWTRDFPSNGADSFGNTWDRDAINTPRHILDLDGDGAVDIIGFGSSRVLWASPASAGSRAARIYEITDSLGSKISLQYSLTQPYSDFFFDEPVTGGWLDREVRGPLLVVSGVFRTLTASNGQAKEKRYRYGGLKANVRRGSLGFRWIAERDELTGIETYREYNQGYPHIGSLLYRKSYKSSLNGSDPVDCDSGWKLCLKGPEVLPGQVISQVTETVAADVLGQAGEYSSNQRYFPHTKETKEEQWELDGTPLPSRTITFSYSEAKQRGNLTKKSVAVEGGFSTIFDYIYEPADEASWNLGLLSEVKTSTTRPSRAVVVGAPVDAAPPPSAAPLKPISPEVLAVILSILLDD